ANDRESLDTVATTGSEPAGSSASAAGPSAVARPRDVMFIASTNRELLPDAVSQTLYDVSSKELHFFCQGFVPAPSGQEYVLAYVDAAGELTVLDVLRVNTSGRGKTTVSGIPLEQ